MSFAHQGGALNYEWLNLSGATILSNSASLQSSKVLIQIPQISQATVFKLKLSVTDENQKSAFQIVELRARPTILPPVAVVRPSQVLLEDSDQPSSVTIDASSSYSRGGGALSYQWDLDSSQVSVQSDSLSSASLVLQASSGTSDLLTEVILNLTDASGLSSTFTVPVQIKAKPADINPVEIEAFFKQSMSPFSLRDNPYFDEQMIPMFLNVPGILSYSVLLLILIITSSQRRLSAHLYDWSAGALWAQIGSLNLQGNLSFTNNTEFYLNDSLPSPGSYAIVISATGSESAMNRNAILKFEVPQTLTLSPQLVIETVESLAGGIDYVESSSLTQSFVDNEIYLTLGSSFTGRHSAHPVEYNYSYTWSNSSAPTLFIESNRRQVLPIYEYLYCRSLQA